jgi:hypothetical protein
MRGGDILDGSLLTRLVRGVGKGIFRASEGSVVRRAAARTRQGLGDVAAGSAVGRWLSRDGLVTGSADTSRRVGMLTLLFQRVPKACGRTLGRLPVFANPGVAARAIGWLANQLHLLCALFLCVVLLVPHTHWNNLYSTGGVAGLFALLFIREGTGRTLRFMSGAPEAGFCCTCSFRRFPLLHPCIRLSVPVSWLSTARTFLW